MGAFVYASEEALQHIEILTYSFTPTLLFNLLGTHNWSPTPRLATYKTFHAMARSPALPAYQLLQPTSESTPTPLKAQQQPPSTQVTPKDTITTCTPAQLKSSLSTALTTSSTFPSDIPVQSEIGKLPLMHPLGPALDHPAAPMLLDYAKNGCPVNCGDDWSVEQILALLRCGPHPSAPSPEAIHQLRAETEDKVKHQYARIVTWGQIKHNIPTKLKVSPVAMIPHKSKAFWCILDLLFNIQIKGKLFHSVNSATVKKAHPQAMDQLGITLKRIVAMVADHWTEEKPFYFAKLDIKDGFWRMAVNNTNAWNFCYMLPSLSPHNSEDNIEIVVPNSLQMGWCEAPPFFCSCTERARDMIQTLAGKDQLPHHKFESTMLQDLTPTPHEASLQPCVHSFKVFVDDFIGSAQSSHRQVLQHFS